MPNYGLWLATTKTDHYHIKIIIYIDRNQYEEAKQILDTEDVISSILLVEDLRIQKN